MKSSFFKAVTLILFASARGFLHADPPVNDNFAEAADLGSTNTATATGTVDEASVETDEPMVRIDDWFLMPYGSTVWWEVDVPRQCSASRDGVDCRKLAGWI